MVRSRAQDGWGPIRLQNELKQKGIIDEIIQCAIVNSGYNWNQLARDVLRKKFRGKVSCDYSEKAKKMRFLQYRGFTQEQIRAAMNSEKDGEE